ncbi:hypothetical protein D3C86_1963220 [compost metagenome]
MRIWKLRSSLIDVTLSMRSSTGLANSSTANIGTDSAETIRMARITRARVRASMQASA